jgi:hypothetical protein
MFGYGVIIRHKMTGIWQHCIIRSEDEGRYIYVARTRGMRIVSRILAECYGKVIWEIQAWMGEGIKIDLEEIL